MNFNKIYICHKMDQNEIEFLWKASKSVPSNSKCSGILSSYYLSKCRKYESYGAIHLPKSVFKDTVTCKFCSNTWKEHQYRVAIKPRETVSKNLKKILRRHERHPESLRKYEENFVKRYQNNSNKLILTCPVCSKKSDWPLKCQNPPTPKIKPEEPANMSSKRKKKKRTKDPLCGLKMSLSEPKKDSRDSPSPMLASPNPKAAPPSPVINTTSIQPIPATQLKTSKTLPISMSYKSNQNKLASNPSKTVLNTPITNKSKKSNSLNKSVLKKMLVKSNAKSSLMNFLNSLP